MKLYRIILPVNDLENTVLFYSKIFKNSGSRVSPGRHYFRLGNLILACYSPLEDGDKFAGGWKFHENQYLYFAVDNLEEVKDRCVALNCNIMEPGICTMPWGERLFYTTDPEGSPLCFTDETTLFLGDQ